jgi:hypothetical protein
LELTLLSHQTRIAPTTTTHKTFVQDERAHWQARGARLRGIGNIDFSRRWNLF